MKKIISFVFCVVMSFSLVSCSNNEGSNKKIEPQASQMKSICELATMQCYYHNVAKYMNDDAAGMLHFCRWNCDRNSLIINIYFGLSIQV